MTIEERQILSAENLLCYRGKHREEVVNAIVKDMYDYIEMKGLKPEGRVITTTYAVNNTILGMEVDVEIMIPIKNKIILGNNEKYHIKNNFVIYDALKISGGKSVEVIKDNAEYIQQYIEDKKLIPITTLYNVTCFNDASNDRLNNGVVDMYLGISYNLI